MRASSRAAAVARLLLATMLAFAVVLPSLGGVAPPSPQRSAAAASAADEDARAHVHGSQAEDDADAGIPEGNPHTHDPAAIADHMHDAVATAAIGVPAGGVRRVPRSWPPGEGLPAGQPAMLERPPRLPA